MFFHLYDIVPRGQGLFYLSSVYVVAFVWSDTGGIKSTGMLR